MADEWNDMQTDFQNKTYYDPDDADSSGIQLAQDRLYVRQIPPDLTEAGLQRAFAKFGAVAKAYMSPDPAKRYGLVTMETPADAQNAMTGLNKTPPLFLNVTLAKENNTRSRQPRDSKQRDHRPRGSNKWREQHDMAPPVENRASNKWREQHDNAPRVENRATNKWREQHETAPPVEKRDLNKWREQQEMAPRVESRGPRAAEMRSVVGDLEQELTGALSSCDSSLGRYRNVVPDDYDFEDEYGDEEYTEYEDEDDVSMAVKRLQIREMQRSYELMRLSRVAARQSGVSNDRYMTSDHKVVVKNSAATPGSRAEGAERARTNPEQGRGSFALRRPYAASKLNGSIDAEHAEPDSPPPLTDTPMGRCVVCERPAAKFCARCSVTPYCSAACQRRDWGPRHRDVCHNLAAHREMQGPPEEQEPPAARAARAQARGDDEAGGREQRRPHGPSNGGGEGPEQNNMGRGRPSYSKPAFRQTDDGARAARRQPRESGGDPAEGGGELRRRPPLRHEAARQGPELAGSGDGRTEQRGGGRPNPPPPSRFANDRTGAGDGVQGPPAKVPVTPAKAPVTPAKVPVTPAKVPVTPAKVPVTPAKAPQKRKETPEHYLPELVAPGGAVNLSAAGPGEAGAALCVAVDDARADDYQLVCEALGACCEADADLIVPEPGEMFCAFDSADGGWYRARCLSSGAGATAALVDAPRVLPLAGVPCKRLPARFAALPEFCCVLTSDAHVEVGDVLMATVSSRDAEGRVAAALVSLEGEPLGRATLARWRPPVRLPVAAAASGPVSSPKVPVEPEERRRERPARDTREGRENTPVVKESKAEPTSKKVIPESYLAGTLSVSAEVLVSVEARVAPDTFVCLTVTDERADDFQRLCGELGEACEADTVDYVPAVGDTFCVLDPSDAAWYRARCLRAGADGRAALLDAARALPLKGARCRALPRAFADIPEFCCAMETKTAVKVGDSFLCAVLATSGGAPTVSLAPVDGGAVIGEARLARWSPPLETPSPVAVTSPAAVTPITVASAAKPEVIVPFVRPPLVGRSGVLLVEASSLERVCVRPADEAARAAYTKLVHDVAIYGMDAPALTTPQPAGAFVVARYVNGNYYRAVVTRTKRGQDKYMLEYLDFGNTQVTTLENLRACPAEFRPDALPVLTSEVRLHNVTALSEDAIKYLNTLKDEEKVLTLTLPGDASEAPNGSAVLLSCGGVQLNGKLEEMSAPEWRKMQEKGVSVLESAVLTTADMEMVELPAGGGELRVLNADMLAQGIVFACGAAEPQLDYVLNRLPGELAAYCDSELGREPYLPRPNELCIARLCSKEEWCRAALVEQMGGPGGGRLHLMCQDHGAVRAVDARGVRKMLVDFARRPGLACMVTIKDFPEDASPEVTARALKVLATRGLRARRCAKHAHGEYVAEAPELIAALRDE